MKRRMLAIVAAAGAAAAVGLAPAEAAGGITPGHLPWPAGGTVSVGRGVNEYGTNAQLAETMPANVALKWKVSAPVCPQSFSTATRSVSVVGSRVFTAETGYTCGYVTAYDLNTGAVLWRRSGFDSLLKPATYRDGNLYITYFDYREGLHKLEALDPATGRTRWSSTMVTGTPWIQAGSGLVTTGLWALNATNGAWRYTTDSSTFADWHAKPYIAGGKVFMNAAESISAYDAATGRRLWTRKKRVPGAGESYAGSGYAIPALHDNRLYVRSLDGGPVLVLDPTTGAKVRTLPRSDGAMTFDGNVAFLTQRAWEKADVLRAVDVRTGTTYWRRSMPQPGGQPRRIGPAPLVANGLLWVADIYNTAIPSVLYAFDETTGAVKSATTLPCLVMPDQEDESWGQASGLGMAQHRLFVPTECGLLTFAASS
jgi:outer membrane protein assembly factor BamB